jgi:predicted RND superfamily exporter protein
MIAVWTLMVTLGLTAAIKSLYFSHQPVDWFPDDDPVRVTTELMNNRLGGGMSLEVIIDTKKENGIIDPDILHRIEAITDLAKSTYYARNCYCSKIVAVMTWKMWSIHSLAKPEHHCAYSLQMH